MSRPSRRRRDPALLRARYRTLFFLLLTLAALALGHPLAAAPAVAGALMGVYSVRVALKRPAELAHTFVVLDWALLGITLALSGGAESWLLLAVPFLVLGQLAGAPREEWVFLAGPSLLLVVILAIADPTLAGSRFLSVAKIVVLVAGGCVAATRLRRRPATVRRREQHAPKVDVSTGLSTAACLPAFLEDRTAAALDEHRPLSVVYVRMEHFEDSRNFLGAAGSEELVRGVARRAERRVASDGRAFRVQAGQPGAGPARPLPRRGAPDGRRPRARRERQPHRRAPADAGDRRLLVPHRAAHRGPARRRPRRSPAGGGLHRGLRHRHPTRGGSIAVRAATTARVLPLPMRLASLRLWRSTSPASRCRKGVAVQVKVRLSGRETSRLFVSGDTLIQLPLDGALLDADGSPVPRTSIFLSELAGKRDGLSRTFSGGEDARRLRRRRPHPTRDRLGGVMTDQADILAAQLAPYRQTPGIVAALLVSRDGFVIAADADPEFKADAVAAQVAGVIDIGARLAAELGRPGARYISLDLDGLNVVLAPFDDELMLVLAGLPSALVCEYRLIKPGA